ncbi:MAG: hypothetical protein ACM3U2_15805 [Deltaproteobacteria bacterium]
MGCQKADDIERYTVARPPQVATRSLDAAEAAENEAIPGQLLGAIVPEGKMTWFFKLTGPIETVKPLMEPFLKFAQSIRLTNKGPEWALPEGWEQLPGSSMRFATLKIPTEGKPLELSVIPLPTAEGDFDAYLLSNVNRWRDQLQLAPISKDELADKVVKIDLAGTPAWLVNYEGRLTKQGGMGGAPFAGRPPSRSKAPRADTPRDSLPFACTVPEGWQPAQANAMQLAAYQVRDGKERVEVSVSTAGGDLAGNINRWRGQIQLPPLDPGRLQDEVQKVTIDGHEGSLVFLTGPEEAQPRQALFGAIVEAEGRQWFIKVKGDAELAAREKAHFEEFVQSIRFRGEK